MNHDPLLFSDYYLRQVLQHQESELFHEIDKMDGNRLLNTSVEDLCDYFEQKYKVEPLQLRESEITVDPREVNVDVSGDPRRFIRDRSRPFYVKGTAFQLLIPYDGDRLLFQCRPNRHTLNPPRGRVGEKELFITFTTLEPTTAEKVRAGLDKTLTQIRQYIEWMSSDISQFNASLRDKTRQRLEARRQKLLKDRDIVASLGFPLKKRADAPRTYVAPTIRRKVTPRLPEASTAPFVPEPVLDMENYEHILSVISNMTQVMERSPQAFMQMKEEDLRQHFLVQLNGQYEGRATGETFNFEGKTDILIREKGRNIFIAECKFWKGPKAFREAIDQLLSYTSWRDTKTALLIFNRGRRMSHVLQQIPIEVKKHPNFKRTLPYPMETGFRFILHHRDDVNRELFLTVLVFEVPAETKTAQPE